MANLISNLKVGTATGTVVAYALDGPTGGTITVSFNNSSMASGTPYRATFTATHPINGTTTTTSTNTYTKP